MQMAQSDLTPVTLSEALHTLYQKRDVYRKAMAGATGVDGTQPILDRILQAAGK